MLAILSGRGAWRRGLILGAYLAILALLELDKFTQSFRAPFVWGCWGCSRCWIYLDATTDRVGVPRATPVGLGPPGHEPGGRRVVRCWSIGRGQPPRGLEAVAAFLRLRVLAGGNLALPADCHGGLPGSGRPFDGQERSPFLGAARRSGGAPPAPARRFLMLHASLLMLFAYGCLVASLASLKPNRSFLAYSTEMGLYPPLYLFGCGTPRSGGACSTASSAGR